MSQFKHYLNVTDQTLCEFHRSNYLNVTDQTLFLMSQIKYLNVTDQTLYEGHRSNII